MAQSSFTCPHGHSWTAPASGVSLIGGKFVSCPTCAALVRVEGNKSTVEETDPVSMVQTKLPPPAEPAPEAATLLQSQLETWRKLPPVEISQIGDYDVMSELGRGGMGVVYRAKHRKLKRIVALKMVLAGEFASGESLRRFQAEAEAVARLQHPNIVQIYELGEQDHKPFFAMEFCDGGSLHDRLDTPMPPRQAAEMLVKVARALHAAHGQGIIHRDLKPANILLTRDNQPKITDFGLAKKLDEGHGRTKTGDVLGTPSYMAPEQAEGKVKEIGPHTDVYALGAILYEMLTARQAFQAETAMDTLLQVLYEEPVAPARLVPRLPADLETICLKCLSKDISKRYGTAEELAQDLERFLTGQPIVARPAGSIEKAVKWAKRRPAAAALIGVSGLAVIGVLGLSLYYNVQLGSLNVELEQAAKIAKQNEDKAVANEKIAKEKEKEAKDSETKALVAEKIAVAQRQLAQANFQKARAAVQSMLTEVGQTDLAYVPLMEEVRRKLLTEALRFNREFLELKGDEPDIRQQAALSHQHLAEIQKMLGNISEAEKENQEAIRQLEKLVADYPKEPDYRRDLAAGHFLRGQLLRDESRYADAEAAYLEARRLHQALADQHANEPEYRRDLARTLTDLGQVLSLSNRPADARESFAQAQKIHEALIQENPDRPDFIEGLGGTLNDLGAFLRASKKAREALDAYGQALARFQDMVGRWPTKPEFRQKQAAALNNLGNTYRDLKDFVQAIARLKEALEQRQKLATQFPSVLLYRQDVAATRNNLAAAYASAGQLEDAKKEYEEAEKIHRQLVADLPRFPGYQSQLAAVLDNQAALLSRRGEKGDLGQAVTKLAEAQQYHEQARKANPTQPLYRLFLRNHYSVLAEALVRQSEKGEGNVHRDAAAAVAEMLKLKADSPDDYYRAAVLFSRCVPLAEKDSGLADDQRQAIAQKYADDAVSDLREALNRGLANREPIKTSAVFNPLRGREDFKKLVGELK